MADNPIVRDIVKLWLKEHGYDGLYNDDSGECACLIDDLAPCSEMSEYCTAGYKAPCDGSCVDGKCDFHVVAARPSKDDLRSKE